MYRIWRFIIAVFYFGVPAWLFAQKTDVMKWLPEKFDAYHISDRLDYKGEALYDYINGGAELYLSYGLAGMTGCKYNGDGLPQVTVEIYEMTSPANAFGVYTQSRDREECEYGQGSQRSGDFLLFWKDRYYVIITTEKATPESSKALLHIASAADKAITGKGRRPAIVDALPKKNIVPGGYLYFHHYVWLNAYLFIADYNIVNISDETDAVLAKYGDAEARCYLLMIDYPDMIAATTALEQLKKEFAPEASPCKRPELRLEDGTWFTTWTRGKRLCAIFEGQSPEQMNDLYHSIE